MVAPAGTMWRIARIETVPNFPSTTTTRVLITLRDDLTRVSKTYSQDVANSLFNVPGQLENVICSNLDAEFFPNDLEGCV